MIDRSAPNCRCQRPSLNSATRLCPTSSSSGRKLRPNAGATPNIGARLVVMRADATLRLTPSCDVVGRHLQCRDFLEGRLLALPILIVRNGDGRFRLTLPRITLPKPDEAIRILVRKRF